LKKGRKDVHEDYLKIKPAYGRSKAENKLIVSFQPSAMHLLSITEACPKYALSINSV
jgi:hypothetical protein